MRAIKEHWEKMVLGTIVLLSVILNFYNITKEGYGNTFYAAGVRSMLENFHNFFFVSFDPGGFVTIDKPPVGFWIQTISAAIFGYKGWSIILPQALAGVVSVIIIYYLVKRIFGKIAGLLSAMVMAITPIFVAASRNNTIDVLLVLISLLATWAIMISVEKSSLKWLLISMLIVGIGFNIKMMEAYLILPAFYLMYMLSKNQKTKTKVFHLVLATVVLVCVSLSWAVVVDLTPANDRPYVGSSQHNSEIELAGFYNGINRLLPHGNMNRMRIGMGNNRTTQKYENSNINYKNNKQKGYSSGSMYGRNDKPSIFRMFGAQLGGQISWLLILDLLGFIFVFLKYHHWRFLREMTSKQQSLILWIAWILPQIGFFSIASQFHDYYTVMLAPGIAALFGITISELFESYNSKEGWISLGLPIILLLNAIMEFVLLRVAPGWANKINPYVIVLSAISFVALIIIKLIKKGSSITSIRAFTTIGVIGILIAPFIWSLTPIMYPGQGSDPHAGPPETKGNGFGRMFTQNGLRRYTLPYGFPNSKINYSNNNSYGFSRAFGFRGGMRNFQMGYSKRLVSFLNSHNKKEKFILAVPNSMSADMLIINTGKPVMAMGGFMGADRILTASKLAAMVKKGQIRYFLLTSQFGGQQDLTNWITTHGKIVPQNEWQDISSIKNSRTNNAITINKAMSGITQLYDCKQ